MMRISKFLDLNHYTTVKSLNDFTEIINYCGNRLCHNKCGAFKRGDCRDNYGQFVPSRLFYRGESRYYDNTSNVAGVYRGGYQQSALYHAYMRRFYKRFKTMDDFSKLTYMQHYGLPTCLLDVTSNALVALYFACLKTYKCPKLLRKHFLTNNLCNRNYGLKDTKYNGIVYLIIPQKDIRNNEVDNPYIIYNNYSDSVSILSTLALLKQNTQYQLLKDFYYFNKYIKKIGINAYNVFYMLYTNKRINKNHYKLPYFTYKKDVEDLKNDPRHNSTNLKIYSTSLTMKNKCEEIAREYFDIINSYEMSNFLHKIRQNVGNFNPIINLKDISKPKLVQPALNNRRVEAQQGYFIFENPIYDFGQGHNSEQVHDLINKNFTMLKIYIPNIYKKKILTELDDNFNINKETLFPDPTTVADYMGDKFEHQSKSKIWHNPFYNK